MNFNMPQNATSPGICTLLKMIEKPFLKELLESEAPKIAAVIDWDNPTPQQAVFDCFGNTTLISEKSRDKLYALLNDVDVLSRNPRDSKYYTTLIEKNKMMGVYAHRIGKRSPPIQSIVVWIYMNLRGVWAQILSKKMGKGAYLGGRNYYLPKNASLEPLPNGIDEFKTAYKKRQLENNKLQVRMHVARDEFEKYVRYTIISDTFPRNVPSFEGESDELGSKLAEDLNVFYILHHKRDRHLQIKSGIAIDAEKSDTLISDFASTVLGQNTVKKHAQKRNVEQFRDTPPKFDFSSEKDYVAHRCVGFALLIGNGNDEQEEYRRKIPGGDFFKNERVAKELAGIPVSLRHPTEIYLEVTIYPGEPPSPSQMLLDGGLEDPRKAKTFSVVVRKTGFACKPTPSILDEAKIERILGCMGLADENAENELVDVRRA